MPVLWCQRICPADEFDRWLAYYQRFPFDTESTQHVPMAMLAALYANANSDGRSEQKSIDDFLLFKPAPTLDEKMTRIFSNLPQQEQE